MIATFIKDIMKKYIQKYNKEKYTYNSLISKDDIKRLDFILKDLNIVSKSELLFRTKINAIKHGSENKNGSRPAIDAVTTISTISIKQLLEDVNSIEGYANCLPIDVLYKLNGNKYKIKYTDILGLKY